MGFTITSKSAAKEQLEWQANLEQNQMGLWWGICHKSTPTRLIGACGLYEWDQDNQNADIGFWLHPDFWRQGIMQEVLPLMIHFGFTQMHLHRIEAEVHTKNIASSELIKRLGFAWEGRRREVAREAQGYADMDYFAILNQREA